MKKHCRQNADSHTFASGYENEWNERSEDLLTEEDSHRIAEVLSAIKKDNTGITQEPFYTEPQQYEEVGTCGFESTSNSTKTHQGCDLCSCTAAYTCPRCLRNTCSLKCLQEHKTKYSCDGQKQFQHLQHAKDFTSSCLRSDIAFFNRAQRVAENSRRAVAPEKRYDHRDLSPELISLSKNARKNGIVLQILSKGMSKRSKNTSRFSVIDDSIIWKVEFRVYFKPFCENQGFTISVDWAHEEYMLKEIFEHSWQTNPSLEKHEIQKGYNQACSWVEDQSSKTSGPFPSPSSISHEKQVAADETIEVRSIENMYNGKNNDEFQENGDNSNFMCSGDTKVMLEKFLEESQGEYEMLCKAERMGSVKAYFKLNKSEPLATNLRTVFFLVEYPTIIVIHRNDLDKFPLISAEQSRTLRESFRKQKRTKHDPQDIIKRVRDTASRSRNDSNLPCGKFLRGKCSLGENCPRKHYKADELPMCRSVMKGLVCKLGERCLYSHDPRRAPASSYFKVMNGNTKYHS